MEPGPTISSNLLARATQHLARLPRAVDFTLRAYRALSRAVRRQTGSRDASLPVNFRQLDASPARIAADVEYAVGIGEEYVAMIKALGIDLRDKTVLELGPGINYGAALILACHGARLIVADRFPTPWRDEYHSRFYGALHDWLAANRPALDRWPLDRVLRVKRYPPEVLMEVRSSAEWLEGLPGGSVDVVLSNAVLEHVMRPADVAHELARVTRPGGYGVHQVDFRDHRDFSHPLEYLLLDEVEFERMFAACHGECGRQLRHLELRAVYEAVGFEVLRFDANWLAEDAYLDDFVPRLRAAPSRYRDTARETLRVISGRLVLRKPEAH
jgi:SAM-dependent methyltransferase